MPRTNEILLDARGRTNLARARTHNYNRYTVEEYPDGTLVLTPAVTISAVELAALGDDKVRSAIVAAKTGDRRPLRPHQRKKA
ncbi:MAG TPA: hypothetical protein VM142_01180 [Acidimicrobiales bacterium]|nr:hypothetical protein [Acidimicrobiales bacterium]